MATTDKTTETRQAARQGRRVPTAGEDQYELTWPYFMYTIVLCFILATISLLATSSVVRVGSGIGPGKVGSSIRSPTSLPTVGVALKGYSSSSVIWLQVWGCRLLCRIY